MSTRATLHFYDVINAKKERAEKPIAIIYRHCDGYPEGLGKDLKDFVKAVQKQCQGDPRFDDAAYLAAKWVVFDALRSAKSHEKYTPENLGKEIDPLTPPKNPLDFLSVGIVDRDPTDIEYKYEITCGGSHGLKIECYSVYESGEKDGEMVKFGRKTTIIKLK